MFHADPFAIAAVFLVAGVIGSLLPLVPGSLLSTTGVVYHWWATGEPGTLVVVLLVTLGLFALVLDWLGGAISARFGGASLGTTAAAALGGIALAFVLGPLGVVVGIFAVVFALECRRHGDVDSGARTAAYATVGILVSAAMQVLLTAAVLVGFLVAVR